MSATPEREARIFSTARKLPAEDRAFYLDDACAGDAPLRQRVEELLQANDAVGAFLPELATAAEGSAPVAAARGSADTIRADPSPSEQPGDSIDRYKLLEKIGEGGFGVVYVAEQKEPVKRRVALKIIKLGMDTKQVVARFGAERQALALMDHPNIAKVLDAGATSTGRPFFVMELVKGIKLTDYCDKSRLSTKERLDLFIQVCRAIQHAHQKGIIHRDIKPSNILVTLHDGMPVPKVIDFGIAKATQGDLTDQTVYTKYQQFIGTPAYMSPEQAEMSGLDIDTRSDIYSLGVLLYELLTGKTPFDPKELMASGIDAMRKTIREKEPVRPSTRVTQELSAVAASRQSAADSPGQHGGALPRRRYEQLQALVRLLRGDLDWIVMKALEKDRTRRYETANGLMVDIQRHLKNEPVMARPPSNLYRFRKMVRRNKLAYAAGLALTAALLIGTAVSTWQARVAIRAQRETDKSRIAEKAQRGLAEENARKATDSERNTQRLLYLADMKLAHAAWEEGNLSRMSSLLEAHRPKPGEADARGFECFYLQELDKGEQEQILPGHTNAVLSVAVSPDGKWLASQGESDTRLWDLTRRSLTAVWPSRAIQLINNPAYGISFSHDSRYLAFPSEEGLQLCDLATRQTRLLCSGFAEKPLFSPVANLIAFNSGSAGPGIRVWDYLSNKEVGIAGPDRAVWCWSPNGSRLLAGPSRGAGGSLDWWDVLTFRIVETNYVAQYIFGAAVSRDGRLTAAADWQGEISLLETPGGKILGTMDCGDIRSSALAFSPDGKFLATASRDQAILIWNLESRRRARQLRGHHAKVASLAYTADGQTLVSGDCDGKVLLWDMARETRRLQITNRLGGFGCNPPRFSADGKLVALAITEDECAVLDASTLQPQSSIRGQFAAFSPDSRQAAFFSARQGQPVLRVTKVGAPSHRATIPLATARFTQELPEISPDGRFLTLNYLGPEGSTLLFDVFAGERILTVAHLRDPFSTSRFLPDGHSWVCAAGSAIDFWDLHSRRKTRSMDCGSSVFGLAVSPDAKFLAASREDLRISLWDLSFWSRPACSDRPSSIRVGAGFLRRWANPGLRQ